MKNRVRIAVGAFWYIDRTTDKVPQIKLTVETNEAYLLARMRNLEAHLVARKTVKDEKIGRRRPLHLQTRMPAAFSAVLYIFVRDNGKIEAPQQNLEEAQEKVNRQMQKVEPRIAYVPRIIT